MTAIRRSGPAMLIFLFFWLLLMIGGRSRFFRDPGTFWHTTTGEVILNTGFFDKDPYSFTCMNQTWVPHQWAGEVFMAIAYRIGGFDSQLVVTVSLLSVLFTWLTLRLLKTGLHFLPTILLTLVVLAAASLQFHVRPLIVTMIFMTLTMERLIAFESQRITLRQLAILIPIFIIWTNFHGGVLGGWTLLAGSALGWTTFRIIGLPGPITNGKSTLELWILVLLCATTFLVNPYGIEIPRAWLSIMSGPKLSRLIEEHRPLELADVSSWPLLVFGMLYLWLFAGLKDFPRVTWLIPLMWFAQSFLRVRHGPLFVLTGLVAVIEIWPRTRWAQWLLDRRPDLYFPPRGQRYHSSMWFAAIPVFVACILFIQFQGWVIPVIGRNWAYFDRKRWPVEITAAIQKEKPEFGQPARIFNSCNLGGYLIFYGHQYKIFIDDRVELYGEDFYEIIINNDTFDHADEAIANWQTKFGSFDYALVERESAYAKVFLNHPDWEVIDICPAAVFLKRRR